MKKKNIPGITIGILLLGCLIAFGKPRIQVSLPENVRTDLLSLTRDVFSLEPAEVKALRRQDVAQEEDGHYEYYFRQLSEDQQRAYREMLSGLRSWEEEFYLTISGDDNVDKIYRAVLNDHPELFWARNRKPVYKTLFSGQDYCTFTPGYAYGGKDGREKGASEEARQIVLAMEQAKSAVASMLSYDASDYEKANVVYTYLIDTTEYVESEDDQSIAGVFWKKEAVCAGYASAVQYLLDYLGVKSIYVEGSTRKNGEGHAWNLVELDGEWYYLDATNGDQPEFLMGDAVSLEEHKTFLVDYLCPFPWEYEQIYESSDLFALPVCESTACNFYVLNNGCFDEYDEAAMEDYFRMRINNNAAVIRLKFTNESAFDQAVESWPQSGELENAIQYYMTYNGLGQIQYHYGVLDSFYTVYYIF